MITQPDGVVVCDKCGASQTSSEESAKAEGWLIDYAVDPHKHFCLKCRRSYVAQTADVMEEQRNNPIPLLIVSGVVGYLLGNVWIGLGIGFGLTIIPFVSLIGLFFNNLILTVAGFVLMAVTFPFFVIRARRARGER